MSSCLIMVTNYFPYYKGEEYIESELPILSKKFDKIIILSCMVDDKQKQTRKIPNNVIAIPSGVSHSNLNRMKMILNGLFISDREHNKISFRKKIYSKYFESRSITISKSFNQRLKAIDFSEYTNVSIYSYWLYITARVAIELKEKNFLSYDPKLISRAHGYDLYEDITKYSFLPERDFIFSNLDFIFPVSECGSNYLMEKHEKYTNKIETKYLGTLQTHFKNAKSSETLHIISVSAVRPLKRLNLILRSISILQDQGLNIKWTHFGDGAMLNVIKDEAKNNLKPGTFNFPGYIKNSDLMRWYEDNPIDLFVNVSESEGIPVSIMEAVSLGIPVLATDVGGTNEIVINKYNGLLINKNADAIDIGNSIKYIMNLTLKEYQDLCNNSLSIWEDKFSALKNYEDFAKRLL